MNYWLQLAKTPNGAKAIKVLDDLAGRSGFDAWWEEISDPVKREIFESIVEILDED